MRSCGDQANAANHYTTPHPIAVLMLSVVIVNQFRVLFCDPKGLMLNMPPAGAAL